MLPFPARPASGEGHAQLLLLALAAACVLASAGAPRLVRAVLPVLVTGSLLPFSSALVPALPRSLYHPPNAAFDLARRTAPQGRVLAMEPHVLSAEIPTAYGLREPRGYDALHPARVAALLRAATDFPGTRTSMELLPARQDVDLPLLGLMGVQLLLDPEDGRPDLPRRPWRGEADLPAWDPFPIVANPHFLPRARIVGRAELLPDDTAALERLRDPSFDRAGAVVLADASGLLPALLPPPPAVPPPGLPPPGLVEFLVERPDTLRLAVHAGQPALLVLADTFFPGWECRVDGVPRTIHRANVAFRAVELRPGDEIVEFRYWPASFALGEVLSLVAALVLYLLVTATGKGPGAARG
ncbi:MAG: YfhO family protein [Planctomycetes bacterium]|nr:YfhO family protein [Planctomycetota bacterium]